jgi:sugar O-acyltransferase (sialic acid O-acetyltransferase NeuD family)
MKQAKFLLTKPLVLLGAGGHAVVLLGLIRQLNLSLLGVCDPQLSKEDIKEWQGIPVLGDDNFLNNIDNGQVELVLGVGQTIGNKIRQSIYQRYTQQGFIFPALVHPKAFVDPSAKLGNGVQVMAGAIIQPNVIIEENVIVNTCASIDHDCLVGSHVHIAPGATVCGGVRIENGAFIGAGSIVVQEVSIGTDAIVTAGTVLKNSLSAHQKSSKRN